MHEREHEQVSVVAGLERLSALRDAGALDDSQFEIAKNQVLGIAPAVGTPAADVLQSQHKSTPQQSRAPSRAGIDAPAPLFKVDKSKDRILRAGISMASVGFAAAFARGYVLGLGGATFIDAIMGAAIWFFLFGVVPAYFRRKGLLSPWGVEPVTVLPSLSEQAADSEMNLGQPQPMRTVEQTLASSPRELREPDISASEYGSVSVLGAIGIMLAAASPLLLFGVLAYRAIGN